jgi:hypothetical protein
LKITEQFKKLNDDSTHYTVGFNTFSLWSTVLLWGHVVGLVTWWAFPLTAIVGLIGFGNEIQERRSKTNSFTLK